MQPAEAAWHEPCAGCQWCLDDDVGVVLPANAEVVLEFVDGVEISRRHWQFQSAPGRTAGVSKTTDVTFSD